MSFHVIHRWGNMEADPPISSFPALLDELDESPDDVEHCSVGVTGEDEWNLGIYAGGYIVFENLEAEAPVGHMTGLSKERCLSLMKALAEGDLDTLHAEPWVDGY